MSDTQPLVEKPAAGVPAKKQRRSLNRWSIGTTAAVQLILLLFVVLGANYLGALHFSRTDFSRDGAYSLSKSTRNYLAGSDVKSRAVPVKFLLVFRRTTAIYERVRALAEEYSRLSEGKVLLEVVDPLRSPDKAAQVSKAYGINLVRDIFIVDARTDGSATVLEDGTGLKTLNPHVKIATVEEMLDFTTDKERQRRVTGFKAEDVITARLVEAIEGQPRRMLLLADKSRIDADGDNSPWTSLEATLRLQNIALEPVTFSTLSAVPEDVQGVVLFAPKYDFTEEEMKQLDSYWHKARSAILVILRPGDIPPKLRAFLRANGVTPRRDRIVKADGKQTISTVNATFNVGIDFIKDLAGQTTIFEGATSSLEVREGNEDLLSKQITATGLIIAGPEFWGESKFGDGPSVFNEQEDNAPPLYIAASVVRGAAGDDRTAHQTSRMAVVANADFVSPENQRGENLDFLASSVNWLVNRESLAGIGSRSLGTYKLPILDAQVSFINRVNLMFLPGLLLIIGCFAWSSRRA